MENNAKAIITLIVSVIGVLIAAIGTTSSGDIGDVDVTHWLLAILAVLGSGALVYIVENLSGVAGGVAKAVMGFFSAGIGSLVVALDDDFISQAEWLTALVTAIVATGLVYEFPGPEPTPVPEPRARVP